MTEHPSRDDDSEDLLARGAAIFVVAAHDLDQSLEAAEKRGPFRAQVEQDLMVRQLCAIANDDDRRYRRERVAREAVRDEADRGRGPQQAVQASGGARIGAEHHDVLAVAERLGGEPARRSQLVLDVRVKINLCHVW
jgi:hypothetical protein